MKESVKKLFAILVLFIMMINSSFLVVVSTAIDAIENLIDESKINPIVEVNLEKYVNYNISDELKGILLQTNIKTGIEYEEGQEYIPIKATKTVVNLPQIDGKYPESLEVLAKSTKVTNGDDKGKDVYYSYDKESGKLEIVVDNKENENGDIYTEDVKGTRDEFVVISNYGADCYNDENIKRDLNITGTIEEILANENETKLTKEYTTNFEVTENISGLISTEVETSDIYNGYINSNKQNGTQNATEYTENMKINISYKELSEELTVETSNKFIDTENKEIETDEIVYKSAKINKQNVLDILGEEGKLQILNKAGEILGEINKDTETQEDGTIQINYESEQTEIIVKTTKPVKLGTIEIENQKTIKETITEIKNKKISNKNTIKCENNIQEKDEETQEIIREYTEEIYNYENTKEIEIKKSETKIDVNLDKTEWTNNVQNDVTITATLVTNGPQYNLFKNPVIEIKLPEEVEKVILGEASLLYDNNLSIKNSEVIDRENYKVIRIELNGTQNEYTLNSIVNGANVIIPATVILKKDINSEETSIGITYTNESGIVNDYNNAGNESKNIGIKINSMNSQTGAVDFMAASVQNDTTNTDGLDIEMYAQVGSDVLKDGDVVYEDQVIKYVVKMTNNSDKTISGIKVIGSVPEGTTYAIIDRGSYYAENYKYVSDETIKEYTFENINILNPGEVKEESYEVIVNDLEIDETEKEIKNQIKTTVNDNLYQNDEVINVVKQAELSVDLKSYIGRDTENSFYYDLYVENLTEHEINDITITTSKFQKEITYNIENLGCDGDHEIRDMSFENRILKFTIDSIETGGKANIKFNLITENFDDKINECLIKMVAKAQVENGVQYVSNENIRTAYPQYVTITKNSDKEGETLSYSDEIEYKVDVKNESKVRTYVSIKDYLPKELNGISAEYDAYVISDNQNLSTEYDIEAEANLICERKKITIDLSYKIPDKADVDIKVLIPAGKTLTITIKAKASYVSQRTEIANSAIVFGEYITTKTSNIVKSYIIPYNYNPNNPDNPDPDNPDPDNPDPDNPKQKYNINGLVWVDNNKDGQRDDREELLSGITVKLYDANTNSIVKDDSGNNKVAITGKNGEYSFTGILRGEYLVLFEYNTSEYDLTGYRINGVSEKNNSDVVLKNVSIDGQEKDVGLTDILKITSSDLENIDMGLVEKEKFDMSLNKSITNLTLKYGNVEKEYNYNDSKLVKVEVPAKNISGASISVEYQIEVKNEGNADGYVDEIIDYLPEGFIFKTDKNSGWTQKSNGILINTSFSGTIIKAGESKTIKLYLTRNITSDTMGILTNVAEIQKSNSINESKDIDSINGNKNEAEDDYSEAELIISVKTGLFKNIIMIIVIFVILMFIIYILKKKNRKNTIIVLFMMIIGTGFVFNQVFALNIWVCHDIDGVRYFSSDDGQPEHAYTCIDSGHPQCGKGNHYYEEYTRDKSTPTTSGPYIDKYIYFQKKDEGYISIKTTNDGYNLVGPYKVSSNYGGKVLVNAQFTTNTGEIISIEDSNNTENVRIADSAGTDIYYRDIGDNSEYCFYLKVSSNITKINFVKTSITIENATHIINSGTQDIYYYCVSIDGDHSHRCRASDGTGDYSWNGSKYACQRMKLSGLYEDPPVYTPATKYAEFGPILITGNIEITKKDVDTGAYLSGTTFTIQGPIGSATQYTYTAKTGGDGKAKVEYLLPGRYKVTETGTSNGYNLNLQGNKTQTISVAAGKTSEATFTNKQYGNLLVTKKDADTGQTQLGGQRLANIKFKLFVVKNGQRQYLNGNASSSNTTHYNYSDFNVSESNKAGAKTFVTNSNAQFAIQNLPVFEGRNPITYYIEEYELPSNLQEYYDVKSDLDVVTIGNGITVNKDVLNKQQYIQISGYVWDDVADESKQTLKNDLYEAPETLVKDITVRLKHTNGTTIDTKVTDQNGAYKFTKVKISELSNYYIEFEYNGLKYTNVKVNNNASNGSKASEKTVDRTSFNNLYSSITGGNAKGNTTTGYSKNENGNVTNNLTYKNGAYSSSLVQNTEYTVASASGSVSAQNDSVGVTMKADTNTAGYTLRWTAGTVEITNVNLGITEREQPDMAISTDLNSIDLTLNGYSHTYTYNKRLKATGIDIFSEIEKWNKTEKEQQDQATNGYLRTYTRSIYKNYVYASGITGDGALVDEDKLQVYLTYKIVVKNESSSLYMSANEIVNYYDKTLDIVESWYDNSNKDKVNVTWTSKGEKNGYNEFRTDSLKDVKIEHGQSITIYIKTKKNNVISWANQNEINDKTYNVTEITSYSSYTKSGNNYLHYAGIDKDSAPDNIIPGRGQEYINRYEDDTDAAPVLGITFEEPKTISGYVFEDVAKYEDGSDEIELHTGKERKGDGQYNAGQDGYVANVKVELIKISEDEAETDTRAYIYPKAVADQKFNAEEAVDITTSESTEDKPGRGYYEFVGVIPGEYYLKYTYDDGSVIYKKVEGTVDVTTQDYKSTIITSDTIKKAYKDNEFKVDGNPQWYQDETIKGYSAAVDDYETRKTINDTLNEITYKVRTGYEDKEGDYTDLQTMTARTSNMSIAIENTNNETTDGIDDEGKRITLYDNINFGIIERPRKSLETTKEIKYIRLILANGQVLAEGDPRTDSIRYVTYPEDGNLKIEVDNEIIEGATLEVTYEIIIENKSELDYDTQRYYKYGEIAGANPVALTINSVIDHMDEELTTTYTYDNSSGWKTVEAKELRDKGLISNDVYAAIQNNHNILVKEDCNLKLIPLEGENIGRIEVNASKLLSTSKEMIYRNYAEVLKVSNSVGRFYGQINEDSSNKWKLTIPGNFNPNNPKNSSEEDTDKVIITIIPPTGQDMNQYVVLSIIGIGCLSLVVGGIVLIKKKVLG